MDKMREYSVMCLFRSEHPRTVTVIERGTGWRRRSGRIKATKPDSRRWLQVRCDFFQQGRRGLAGVEGGEIASKFDARDGSTKIAE